MKLITIGLLCCLFINSYAQQNVDAAKTALTTVETDPVQLSTKEYDFGSIPYGKPVYTTFTIKNTSTKDLVVNNIATSCGCTTPEWEQSPIKPGEARAVKVGFNGYSEGNFSKTVTITYDDSKKVQYFVIKGIGYKQPDMSTKTNSTLNAIKQSF
jgi:hypothetical protein